MEIYIKGSDGTLLKLPVNPESLEVNENQKVDVIEVLNAGEIPLGGYTELQSLSFESFLPTQRDGNYIKQGMDALSFINKLRGWKKANQPIRLVVSGLFGRNLKGGNLNQLFLISDFKTKTQVGYESDIIYSLKLIEYKALQPRKLELPKPTPAQPNPPKVLKPAEAKAKRNPTTTTNQKRTHTVVRGDCLWKIARKYYGNGAKWRTIYNANKAKIKNPNLIYPGQVLVIP